MIRILFIEIAVVLFILVITIGREEKKKIKIELFTDKIDEYS